MRPAGVVECDPVANGAARMGEALEALPMHALLLQRPDKALHHAVLLRTVRGDELLTQAVAADHLRVIPAGEDEPVVAAKQELRVDAAERAEPGDERLLERGDRGRRFPTLGQVPAEQLARVAVHDERERRPAVLAGPDAAEVG